MDCIPSVGDAADDPYIDGNPDIGTGGSIPPEAAIEHLVREIVSAITALGGTADSVRALGSLQSNQLISHDHAIYQCTSADTVQAGSNTTQNSVMATNDKLTSATSGAGYRLTRPAGNQTGWADDLYAPTCSRHG